MSHLVKTLCSLSENGFLQLHNHKVKSFDTLGLLVRANVKNQLKKFYKQNDKFSHFLSNDLNDVQHFVKRFSKLDSLINSFALVYKQSTAVQCDLISKRATVENDLKEHSTSNSSVLQLSHTTHLNQLNTVDQCLALFCDQELSLNYFHWLQSQRHRFWRKLATNPSTYRMTNVNIDENNFQNLNIIYQNNDLNLDIEQISYHKTLDHLDLGDLDVRFKDYWSNLDLIVCKTSVDLSTLGLLCDSYTEKNGKSFMSLSEYLTPYQYAITVINSERKLEVRCKELVNYIFYESKKSDLNIYPFVSFNDKDNLLFDSYDQIGVLYTILIEANDLEKGILSMRNRDTNIIEKFHVTQLKSYLSLYAKLN